MNDPFRNYNYYKEENEYNNYYPNRMKERERDRDRENYYRSNSNNTKYKNKRFSNKKYYNDNQIEYTAPKKGLEESILDERIIKYISEKMYHLRLDYDKKIDTLKDYTLKLKKKISVLKTNYQELKDTIGNNNNNNNKIKNSNIFNSNNHNQTLKIKEKEESFKNSYVNFSQKIPSNDNIKENSNSNLYENNFTLDIEKKEAQSVNTIKSQKLENSGAFAKFTEIQEEKESKSMYNKNDVIDNILLKSLKNDQPEEKPKKKKVRTVTRKIMINEDGTEHEVI